MSRAACKQVICEAEMEAKITAARDFRSQGLFYDAEEEALTEALDAANNVFEGVFARVVARQ